MIGKAQTFLALLGLTFIGLILVELAGRGLFAIKDAMSAGSDALAGVTAPALAEAGYDANQLRCTEGGGSVYAPYLVWTREPCKGPLFNTDENGRRVTDHNSSESDAIRIWLLGGSTVWGSGAPDDQTIASHLAYIFNRELRLPTAVTNYGEHAYVSTQEVILLLTALRDETPPDILIFYDGSNDAAVAALWPEPTGAHWNLPTIAARFAEDSAAHSIQDLLERTAFNRAAAAVSRRLTATDPGGESSEAGSTEIAQRAVGNWLHNHRIVTALSSEYGFRTYFFLQPGLGVGKKPLHQSEQDLLDGYLVNSRWERIIPIRNKMRDQLASAIDDSEQTRGIYDIADVFSSVAQPLYYDVIHTNGEGYRLVASAIATAILDDICRDDASTRAEDSLQARFSQNCS